MAIITFWNNNTGKIGQTHSALATASYMAIEHNYKVLLVSTRYGDNVLREAFIGERKTGMFQFLSNSKPRVDIESGIEGMSRLAMANRLVPDMVPNYTKIIYKNRLEIISAPRKKEETDYDKLYDSCKDILAIARKHYDIIFVDVNNGLENDTTKEILNMSDIIILNIEQKLSEMKKILKIKENTEIFKPKKVLTLINRYDRKSKYSCKNISRELGEKKEILSIPYCNLFSEAVQEGVAAEFFLNTRIKKLEGMEDRTSFFIKEIKRTVDTIVYKMQELQMRG